MLLQFAIACRVVPHFPWFARVPSAANPADEPSREEVQRLAALPLASAIPVPAELLLRAAGAERPGEWGFGIGRPSRR